MADLDTNGIRARLWRLPGQLLLALINATAILIIVAAVVALVAISRINRFAEDIAATMTQAVLSNVDLPARDVLANLQTLTAEVRKLGDALEKIRAGENPTLQAEIANLKERLTILRTSLDQLAHARSLLSDEAIRQLGRSLTDALQKLRDCNPEAGEKSKSGHASRRGHRVDGAASGNQDDQG